MSIVLCYRGRVVRESDVAMIQELIARHPAASRRQLSARLCEAWDWRQPSGALRDMVCRSLMLALHRGGHITLPPVRHRPPNNALLHRLCPEVSVEQVPLRARLREIGPLTIGQVRRTDDEGVFDSLVAEHHYLGYTRPVGEQLKFLVWAGEHPVACFGWSSAVRHLAPRDRFIGWSAAVRRMNLRYLAYNTRFLILPWVEVPHLASHLLARVTRELSAAWEQLYGHPVYFAETFVDPTRFRGTCYRAAGWTVLGQTTGRGKNAPSHRANRPKKDVLGLALTPRFRALLSQGTA